MRYLQHICIALLSILLFGETLQAQTTKPTLGPRFPRKALVRNDCVLNTFVSEVEVSGNKDFNNIVDTDLENYGTIIGAASVGALVKPILNVRDTKHYYATGTRAGFCIQADKNSGLLELNVLKSISIFFYKDGEKKGSAVVDQGNDTGLLNLGLIQIPGDEEGVVTLSATAPCDFDEIALMDDGINASVVRTYKIRYAFVGDIIERELITKNIPGIKVKCWGDIHKKENIINDDIKDSAIQRAVLGLILPKASVTLTSDTIFPAKTEVGFLFKDQALLGLNIGSNSRITVRNTITSSSETVHLQAQVLGLGLIGGEKSKVSIISQIDFNEVEIEIDGLNVDVLGTREFYYGFVAPAPEVPHNHDLKTTMDSYIGMDVTQYEMFSNLPAHWKIISQPQGEKTTLDEAKDNKSAIIKGMTPNVVGEYKVEVSSKDCSCKDTIVIKRGNMPTIDPNCKKPLRGDNLMISDTIRESSGSLISISDIKYKERIIDDKMETFAEYVGGVSLANNLQLVGVKSKDGKPLHDGKSAVDVGFVMEVAGGLLNAGALEFYQIRLYNDGKKVSQHVVKNTQIVSAGLIEGEKSAKRRFGIELEEGIEFDEMTIWLSGVLNLGLSKTRIFGGYITDTNLNCYEDPLACGSTVIKTDEQNAYFNYNHTRFSGVSIGTMTNLEHILDADTTNFAVIAGVTAGAWSISINLGKTMDRSHQACVIFAPETHVANVGLLDIIEMELYNNGTRVTTTSNGGVLGLDALGLGDKVYMFTTPTASYDEIRLISGHALKAEGVKIYGVAVRDDVNRNGIPDCLEDPMVLNVSGVQDLCVGEQLFLTGESEPNLDYNVVIEKLGINKNFNTGADGKFLWDLGLAQKPVNWAEITIEDLKEGSPKAPLLHVTVHPNRTRWTSNKVEEGTGVIPPGKEDWNEWINWDRGTPWSCTDVIIPTTPNNAQYYPTLDGNETNACRYIHFEHGGEVVNTHHLQYERAWVELKVNPNRYYMVTMPLKEIYSGDWFIPKAYPDTFTVLNENTTPANRMTPTIYQRLWESSSMDRLINGKWGPVNVAASRWSRPFNYLATPYNMESKDNPTALSVWVHPSTATDNTDGGNTNTDYTFRFPKVHPKYFYYNDKGVVLSLFENVKRKDANIGRFITEGADSTVTFPFKVKLYNGHPSKTYLAPNPFMSHIDVNKFLTANPEVNSIKVYKGKGNNTYIAADGEGLLSSAATDAYAKIAPLQSFFVTVDHDATMVEITFTEEMLCQQAGVDGQLKSAVSNEGGNSDEIYLTAESGSLKANALVHFSPMASDNYSDDEDAESLLEGESIPTMELFTIAGERALDIQQRKHGGAIHIGIYSSETMERMRLTVKLPAGYEGWQLEDRESGLSYPLDGGAENEVVLEGVTTQAGRLLLRGATPTDNETITATPAKVYAYLEAGSDRIVVRSMDGMMKRCEIFTANGMLSGIAQFESDEYRMTRTRGVNIIKVYFLDGRIETLKLFTK